MSKDHKQFRAAEVYTVQSEVEGSGKKLILER